MDRRLGHPRDGGLSLLDAAHPADRRDERPLGVRREPQVQVVLVAHRLDHVDGRLEVATTLDGADDLDVLRPDPERGVGRRLQRLAGVRRDGVAELPAAGVPAGRVDELVTLHLDLEEVHRRLADEPRDEPVGRLVVRLQRRRDLLELPVVEDRDPVAHRHRLRLVVGDVDGGRVEILLEPLELRPHLRPELGVEIRQRLVHQEHLRLPDDRPPERDPLALPAGQLRRCPFQQLRDPQHLRRLVHERSNLVVGHLRRLL